MASPLLNVPGAIAGVTDDGANDLPVALHYGSPLKEQRALELGNAFVDLSHRGVVTVSGDDRLTWLNSMTSQQLTGLRPGDSTETLLLDPNGRIQHAIRVVDDGARTWLLVDEGSSGELAKYLTKMRFAMRVEVADMSAEYATVLAFAGGSALPALESLTPVATWIDPWAEVEPGGIQYARGEHAGASWSAHQAVLPVAALTLLAQLVRSGEIQAAGLMALDALEIRAWRPSRIGDVDDRSIPHEFDWLRSAVHLTKGCYRGQETVAKVHNLGRPPRRFTLLHLDGSEGMLPEPGALVYKAGESSDAEARPVGRVTRAALHYEWGGIALALLKRSVPEDAALEVRIGEESTGTSVAASQEVIVPADAGAARDIPRFKRL